MASILQVSVNYWRCIRGRISRLGDDTDAEGTQSVPSYTPTTVLAVVACHNYHYMEADIRAWKDRALFEIDLTGVPRNSYIQSCLLRLRRKQWVTTLRADAVTEQTTVTMAMYKAEAKPWNQSAILAKYDGTNNWAGNGMLPNQDYYAASALRTDVITKAGFVADEAVDFDLTEFARECIDRDDRKMRVVWKPEDAFEIANFWGRWFQDMDDHDMLQYYGPTETNVSRRPIAVITYTPPLAFFASNQDGTIDESREIFLGAGQKRIGTVVHDPNATSYQETPCKIWLKNQLSSLTMKAVKVESPANWATFPEPDAANTGDGYSSDVSTSPSLTIDEQWKIEFTSATEFSVYRDSGTGDDPAQEQTWTLDGTGTVGTLYTSATRGISFTLTTGGTGFVSGDKFTFQSYQDYSIVSAPGDSDYLLEICEDSGGSPDGNWYYARPAMTTLTQQVVASNLLHVALAKYFNPGNKLKVFKHDTRTWSSEYTVQAVNKTTNEITLVESISAEIGDWVHAVRIAPGDISPGSSVPLWARGVSFSDTAKEEKYQYLRAQEGI